MVNRIVSATAVGVVTLGLVALSGAAHAANVDPTGPYTSAGTCAEINVTPAADACFGFVNENSNAQSVDWNLGEFDGTTGLFGIQTWTELFTSPTFPDDQKSGSFAVGDYSAYMDVVVALKGSNTWAAYRHIGGLGPVMYDFTMANDRGLSNYVIIGSGENAPIPAPLPAAAWMLLAGLGGLFAMKRRRAAA